MGYLFSTVNAVETKVKLMILLQLKLELEKMNKQELKKVTVDW